MTESVSESSATILSNSTVKKSMKILHVDDDQAFLKVAKQCLEMQGIFAVDTASSVNEVLKKLEKTDYDAIVCDYQMPGKDGLEFLKELRANGNNTPFIVFTGKGREEIAVKALNLGADGYFNKHGETETVYGELAHGIRSVVDRKTAEMKILEREEKLKAVFSSSPDAIIVSGFYGAILDCNAATWKMFGFSSREEVIGKSSFDFIAEKDRQKAYENLKKTLEQGTIRNVEYTLLKKDGEEFCGELSASIIKDTLDNPVGFVGAIREITERKRSEAEIKRLASFPEENPNPVLEIDLTGKTTYLNPTARKMLSSLHDSKLSDGFEQDLKTIIGEFNTHRIENFVRENVQIGDRHYEQLIHYVPENAALRIYMADTTERSRARKTLRESEEKYRRLVENLQEGVWAIDKDSFTTFVNSRMAKILGYTVGEMLGKSLFAFMDERGIEIAKRLMERRAQGIREQHDFEFVKKDGSRIYATLETSPINDSNGNYIGALAGVIDFTERKKAEEKLKESENKFRLVFEGATDGILAADAKTGKFVFANLRICEITGYSEKELLRLRVEDIHPKKDLAYVADTFTKQLQRKIEIGRDMPVLRKDGDVVYCDISAYPLEVEERKLLVGLFRDVTDRKNAERVIIESQQKFEALFKDNPEAAVYLDLDFKILDVNPRFSELFGYSAKEIEGKLINEVVTPEDMIEEAERLDKDVKKGYASRDTVRKRKDGSLVHVSISAAPINIEGKLLSYIEVYKDITDLKDVEKRLRETNKRLEATNEKLHVVGGLTRHDVRNKLTAVTGNVYLLRRKLTEDPKALEQLNDMETAVRLVERILEFARIYEKLGVEQLANLDVGEAVAGAVSLFSDLKGVRIVNECRGLTVLADSLLSQLFYNLVDNSLKHGEKIRQIKIHYNTLNADQLELVYEDDGVGIPDSMRSNLFKEGFTSGKGTGYGLFMIKRMCEVYGWTIQETGRQGKGAQFTITIPKTNSDKKENYHIV